MTPNLYSASNPYSKKEKVELDDKFEKLFNKYVRGHLQLSNEQKSNIREAYILAKNAHEKGKFGKENQRRNTGKIYMTHPLAVFKIGLKEMNLGYSGLMATLLHDVLEDTSVTENVLVDKFGNEIVHIVKGVTKLTHDIYSEDYPHNTKQVANFKHLMMDLGTYDILLVKLADRLHNMRTMDHMVENKRFEKAAETTYIFVPLAHKLGLSNVKKELEDLSLNYRHEKKYNQINNLFKNTKKDRIKFENEIIKQLSDANEVLGLNEPLKIKVIKKSCYSIYRKMESRNLMYENIEKCLLVNEIYKLNIVIEDPTDENMKPLICWKLYGYLGTKFNLKTSRLRDWMTTPKGVGYRSIHIPIMNKKAGTIWEGLWIETKIRTASLHKIVRKGYDRHGDVYNYNKIWGTRLFVYSLIGNSCEGKDILSKNELEILRKYLKEMSNKDFHQVADLLKVDEITIYDEKGANCVINGGATVLDLAFKKNDENGVNLGFSCCGALLNGVPVKLNTTLMHEDQVELKFHINKEGKDEGNYAEKLSMVKTLKAKAIILNKIQKTSNAFETSNGATYHISPCCNPIKGDKIYVKKNNDYKMDIHRTMCLESLAHDGANVYSESKTKLTTKEKQLGVKKIFKEDIWCNKNRFLVSIKVEGINKDQLNKKISDIISGYDIVSTRISLLPNNSYYFEGNMKFYVKNKEELIDIIESIYRIDGVNKCAREI